MTLFDLLILLLVAGLCGALGQAITGYSRGGCLVSIALGFLLRRAPAIVGLSSAPARQQSNYGNEQGRTNDRPDDRKSCRSNLQIEEFRQAERAGQPNPQHCPHKTQGNGDQTPAA